VVLYGDIFEIDYFYNLFIQSIQEIVPTMASEIFTKSSLTNKMRHIGPSATAIIKFFIDQGGE
jgi:hypothetical protein